VIINSLRVSSQNLQATTKDVRDIALILANVDPHIFSLLSCLGVKRVFDLSKQITGFELIFELPSNFDDLRSLRTILLADNYQYPLDDRFRLARLLARSVSFLHSSQIVHKNISPETILLLKDSQTELDTPFLVGFEKFRRAEGHTQMSGDNYWERNLYRHPNRQGEQPEERFKMQHDIYSLGVCLLEIGLGASFVEYEAASISKTNPKGAEPTSILGIKEDLKIKDVRARAFQIKRKILAIAEAQLPGKMGKVYTNIVVSCLACLDKNNKTFGDESEFMDEDGILVGVRYIEKVLYQVEEFKF